MNNVILNDIEIVYGFYDITPYQGEFVAKKLGYKSLDDLLENRIYDKNLYAGYNTLYGDECLVIGYFIEGFNSTTKLNNLISKEVVDKFEKIYDDMQEKELSSQFLMNGFGFIFLKDMPHL